MREAFGHGSYGEFERGLKLLRMLKALVSPFADEDFDAKYWALQQPEDADNDKEFEAAMARMELILKHLAQNGLYAYTLPDIEDGGDLAVED
jgi:hypothetical protein